MFRKLAALNGKASKALTRAGLADFVANAIMTLAPGSTVLSIGAGGQVGSMVRQHARAQSCGVIELDIDPARGPEIVGDLCRLPLKDSSFDAIVACEVLEHVRDPLAACQQMARVLRPRGRLILSTPFVFPIHDAPHDYFRFTRFGLAHLLSAFDEVDIQDKMGWAMTGLAVESRVARAAVGWRAGVAFLYTLYIFLRLPVCRVLDHFIPFEDISAGYFVSARKQ